MKKAFDVQVLIERLKAAGVPLEALKALEQTVKKMVPVVLAWVKESIQLKGGIFNKLFVWLGFGTVEKEVNKWVDAIDGIEGN